MIYYAAKITMLLILILGVDFGNVEVKIASVVIMFLWLIQGIIGHNKEMEQFYKDITK